ncbi:MAG: DUF2442 domain-containing protein [Acetobacteraceae bacterium]|nr:DUF2442 domain-containing protein [Acetobacteraceae bacterium]
MAVVSDAELKKAEVLGVSMLESEPRALAARYEPETGRVVIDLVNGCTYAFPTALVQDLQSASHDDLAGVQVDGLGFNLHFPALDADLYVPALVSGIFGTQTWMARELARIAGRKTSMAKTLAARTNGAKGGRPRKVARG